MCKFMTYNLYIGCRLIRRQETEELLTESLKREYVEELNLYM